jgi:hypothetical protein
MSDATIANFPMTDQQLVRLRIAGFLDKTVFSGLLVLLALYCGALWHGRAVVEGCICLCGVSDLYRCNCGNTDQWRVHDRRFAWDSTFDDRSLWSSPCSDDQFQKCRHGFHGGHARRVECHQCRSLSDALLRFAIVSAYHVLGSFSTGIVEQRSGSTY